jgi:hypothetical protein
MGEMTVIASVAASEKAAKRLNNLRPFKPGQSGNPGGRPSNGRRHQELFVAIAGAFGELSALEREFVGRAAEQLRRAERETNNAEHVRLTRCAAQLIDRVRDLRRERQRKPSGPTLAEYIASKAKTAETAR